MSSARLAMQIQALKLPPPETEYRFYQARRWRADYCWPDHMLIVEYDGGTWNNGRHTRGLGFQKDCEKLNRATLEGFRVLRFTSRHVKSGLAIEQIQEALGIADRHERRRA